MKIFLLRHSYAGEYIGRSEKTNFKANPEDMKRVLLAEGIEIAKAMAAWMQDNDAVPTVIMHSPIMRAKQTAGILARVLGVKAVPDDSLQISKPMEMLVKKVAADPDMKRVAMVAHSDNIVPGLRALNFLEGADKYDVDPIAMCELRILKVDRDSFTWEEQQRVLPSDLNLTDYY